jgi:hypothetical protein
VFFEKKRKKQNSGHRRQDTEPFDLRFAICDFLYVFWAFCDFCGQKIGVYRRSPREIGKTVISWGKSAIKVGN